MEECEREADPIAPDDLALLAEIAAALGWLHWATNGTSDWDGPPGATFWADWGDPVLYVHMGGEETASTFWNPLTDLNDAVELLEGFRWGLSRPVPDAHITCRIWAGDDGRKLAEEIASTPQRAM